MTNSEVIQLFIGENSTPALPAQLLDPYRATSQSVSLAPEWERACTDTHAILLGAARMSLEGNVKENTPIPKGKYIISLSSAFTEVERKLCYHRPGSKLSLQVNTVRTSHACDYS